MADVATCITCGRKIQPGKYFLCHNCNGVCCEKHVHDCGGLWMCEACTTHQDWICKICGGTMLKTSENFIVCERGCGKLCPAPIVSNLPEAGRVDYKRFDFQKIPGFWEYVPHAHKKALEKKPKPGTLVARIFVRNRSWETRTFRPSCR